MNSVLRSRTFFAALFAAILVAVPAVASAEPSAPVAQNEESERDNQSDEESSDETQQIPTESPAPNEKASDQDDQAQEETEKSDKQTSDSKKEESAGRSQQQQKQQETSESAQQDTQAAGDNQTSQEGDEGETDESDPMSPAGDEDIPAPGELGDPQSAEGDDVESGGTDQKTDDQQKVEKKQDEKQDKDASPISDLAESQSESDGFEPVEDIEEEMLQEVTPTKVYPHLEWDGFFRVRSDLMFNADLDTEGTSAILPPAETYRPPGNAADGDSQFLWSTNMNLRFDPTLHITETLSVHVEADLLDNVVLGSLSDQRLTGYQTGQTVLRPDPSRTVTSANQIPPREQEVFENAVRINEAYGEIRSFFGAIRAGRMDFDWGLGTYANGGDCPDCDYGDHVDRIMFVTQPAFDMYTAAALDFPSQGETSASPVRIDGQPYDAAQIDDARQYTFAIFRKPITKEDKERQQKRLKGEQKPVFDGGLLFSYRTQRGEFLRNTGGGAGGVDGSDGAALENAELVYRGLNMYIPDLWFRVKYNPDPTTKIRVELEGTGVFGSMDNTTDRQLSTSDINCFSEDDRSENPEQCTQIQQGGDSFSTDKTFAQLGGALESMIYLGGPVRFGLNAGYASGGDAPNYGYQGHRSSESRGESLDFYRFDPNYHVDLILFREVIGTVTNAYYANPYVQARFFETPDRRLELQFDTIVSRAANQEATPAGDSNWLGVEMDGAVRYLQTETFRAGLEGGILFPLGGLDAVQGQRRLTRPGNVSTEFTSDESASIAWTVQTNLTWLF